MIELQSIGLKFGMATESSSYMPRFNAGTEAYLSALCSAIKESMEFWGFDYRGFRPVIMQDRMLNPWQIINDYSPLKEQTISASNVTHTPFIVPISIADDMEKAKAWHRGRSGSGEMANSVKILDPSRGRCVYSGQSMLVSGDGYVGEGVYCVVMRGFITDKAKYDNLSKLTFVVSEPFSFSNDTADFVEFIYKNEGPDKDILINNADNYNDVIDFSDGYFFRMLLPTQIGRPNYVFEEEISERGGFKFTESQISKKTYNLSFPANESMCDNLRIAKLCSKRLMLYKGRYYPVTAMDMSVEWTSQEGVANTSLTIEVDNVITTKGLYQNYPTEGDFDSTHYDKSFYDSHDSPKLEIVKSLQSTSEELVTLDIEIPEQYQKCDYYVVSVEPISEDDLSGEISISPRFYYVGSDEISIDPFLFLGRKTKDMEYTPDHFTFRPSDYTGSVFDRIVEFRALLRSLGDAVNGYPITRVKITVQCFNE